MKTSPQGLALIKAFEGLFLAAYRDPVGIWTIGYGHTDAAGPPKVKPGMKITEAEATAILAADLEVVEREVERAITVPMTQYEFDAFVSFHFNTGCISKGTVDDHFNRGNKSAAGDTLLKYVYAGGGRLLRGLVRRREAEHLMLTGRVQAGLELAGVKDTLRDPHITNPSYIEPVPAPVKKKESCLKKFWAWLNSV